jgi:hypothetical protein
MTATEYIPADERTFDTLPSLNERRLQLFPLADVLEDRPLRSYTWRHVQTDQGREGACVGHGVTQEAAARPKPVFGDPLRDPPNPAVVNAKAYDAYLWAQLHDEYPSTPPQAGSSVDAGMRYGLEQGWWREFRWATSAWEVAQAVAYHGPVVAGGWWRSGMDRPDADGMMSYSGNKRGGHCFLFTRVRRERSSPASPAAVWTPNSWGGAGQGWLTLDDVDAFLADGGEAAIPMFRHL